MRRGGTLGERWDTRWLRRVREYGWFRQHEAEMIEAARRRMAEKQTAADDPKEAHSPDEHSPGH